MGGGAKPRAGERLSMNVPILRALLLTCAGNAFLRGRDLAGFWPDAKVFMFSKVCDFRLVDDKSDRERAPNPLAWFETLRGAKGLRLHQTIQPPGPGQTLAVPERMMAGFVGGGRTWLIEVVGEGASTLWQGFSRLGDRNESERKIWRDSYLRIGETTPQDSAPTPLPLMADELNSVLTEIEALARRMSYAPWPDVFGAARACLTAVDRIDPDFARYADFSDAQQRLLAAVSSSYVFGGMGSWNDIAPADEYQADYDRLSEHLYTTLNDAVCALANSTYEGSRAISISA